MPSVEEMSIRDLPEAVIEAAMRRIADYSIGFVRVGGTPWGAEAKLLGSGTLVSVGAARAVLTAHHVMSNLPTTGRLGLLLGQTPGQDTVDVQGLGYLEIARGTSGAVGPDLGAVILAPSIASAVAAKKSFYNLDLHRNQLLHSPPDIRDGFWFINGYIDEKTTEEREKDGYDLIRGFFNLSGVGVPKEAIAVGEHDYFDFPVIYDAGHAIPKSFGGMSGGGLWQVPLKRDPQGQMEHSALLLSGVVFYQERTSETSCNVKCHGRQSVYGVAYDAIQRTEP